MLTRGRGQKEEKFLAPLLYLLFTVRNPRPPVHEVDMVDGTIYLHDVMCNVDRRGTCDTGWLDMESIHRLPFRE